MQSAVQRVVCEVHVGSARPIKPMHLKTIVCRKLIGREEGGPRMSKRVRAPRQLDLTRQCSSEVDVASNW